LTVIKSKDNPTIKMYVRLAESKKERKNYNMYVLEGYRLICDALSENSSVKQILMTEYAYEKYYNDLSQADLKEVKMLIISNELGMKISCTEKTQGIFAICSIPVFSDLRQALESGKHYMVLYQIQDPGNLGMIIRTADAVGIDGVILSQTCELFNPKTIRSTMGSVFRTKIFNDCNIDEILEICRDKGISTYAAVIDSNAENLKKCLFTDGGAVIIGNEGNGLPSDVSDACDKKVTIKMNGNVNSLNAAMAAGIMMWEMKNNS